MKGRSCRPTLAICIPLSYEILYALARFANACRARARALHITIHQIAAASMVLFAIAMMFNRLAPLSLTLSLSLTKIGLGLGIGLGLAREEDLCTNLQVCKLDSLDH
jgi:hypothetical protein